MPEAKVYISGPIVADSSEAGNAYPYCTLEDVTRELEYQKPFDAVRVIINSPGGRVDKGMAMYDYLRSLPGVTITTEAIGQCSSIATAVFLAGSVRIAHQHTESLVHLPIGGINGATAEQAQAWADEMARCEADLLALYVARAGVEEATFREVMRAATTLVGQELMDYGFATQILQPATALALVPTTATTPAPADQMPGWAHTLMSKFNLGLAAMASALTLARKPATAQAPETEAAVAGAVTTTDGTGLHIHTGDSRTDYQVGDMVYTDDTMATEAADGDYSLDDGNTITVAAGAITVIMPTDSMAAAPTASADSDAAIAQLVSTVTALATTVGGLQTQFAAQAKVVNRVAATAGSRAVPTRANAANDEGKDAPVDPVKAAGDARRARREAKFKK
ncbi:ATP-dependent Clp protease proteolytic subunit [Hymenobacter sp. H14-R3]|uniref:ATP-dependent Clp protease proteolytic subunit n=1 Tax=Hymenobacter sp. H14-R3 TaxID=3046308 RepID=UPI0024BA61AF|nr:ATP-dependent Clp protease proteolytic subunit [Hymenobacter sp. H14-R3]MDJ0367384.1 ATP-dependent Clp protease proteolytic subunit [Hymenobacter sp. H14-R3]